MIVATEDRPKCSYCGKPCGSSYSFSYGVPGIPRIFSCYRRWCRFTRNRRRLRWQWWGWPLRFEKKRPQGVLEG